MISSYSIALSGLNASSTRLGVAANNIANAQTTGAADNPSSAYQPQEVVQQSAGESGGVTVSIRNTDPATIPAYVPTDANANADRLVALPNVSLENEMVTMITAKASYKANLSVIQTQSDMDKALLDIKA